MLLISTIFWDVSCVISVSYVQKKKKNSHMRKRSWEGLTCSSSAYSALMTVWLDNPGFLQLTEEITCEGQARGQQEASGVVTFAQDETRGRRSDVGVVFFNSRTGDIQRGGCWEWWGREEGCLEEGDGMHCDSRASQTPLASRWLHCTLETQTEHSPPPTPPLPPLALPLFLFSHTFY